MGEQGCEEEGVEDGCSERLELSDRLCCVFIEMKKVNGRDTDGSSFDGRLRG